MLKINKPIFRLLIVTSAFSLFGCTVKTGCSESSTKCFSTSKGAIKGNVVFSNNPDRPQLDPNFNYIRLNMNGHIAWLAQGASDQWPSVNTEVFYSADRSIFKWSNGRLIAVTTAEYDWREHIIYPLNWSAQKPQQFMREIDTVDGITAVRERRELSSSGAPEHHNFVGDKTTLNWIHEYTISKSPTMQAQPTFDSWFAFDSNNMNKPVYGQQCISKRYCLSWQVWKSS
ncbi:Uncharacterised protein [Psychrobacter phenylpyruvicus]|uniref:Lipoprotein n=2 Tax=Psychrobacter phenylpyruvicus TaxID=29432 RepID=A0A379LQ66_9GAMM|nr:Uncharacterised protein [Psychrobacter phenylpyruvicus]